MSHIAVTGAGGYIGRFVVEDLLDSGHKVTAVDLNTESVDPRAHCIKLDIFKEDEAIYEKMQRPDILIHMAWRDGFVHNSPQHMEYLPMHYQFLNNMLQGGLRHFSVMGTMHEIGYWVGEINEDTPTNPLSLYGIAKNTLRQACDIMVKQYPDCIFQWLRAFYIYGDDKRNNSIFAKILEKAETGARVFPLNSGMNQYDFIEVHTLAKQIAAASTQNEFHGIINCCTGEPLTLKAKVEEFIEKSHLKISPVYGAYPERSYDSPMVWGNAEKINKIQKALERSLCGKAVER